MPGLMSLDPHARYTRARYPDPPTGTMEIRPAGKIQGDSIVEYHAPPILPAAEQIVINATALAGFNASTMWQYNLYASGRCAKPHDPICPCGVWADVRDGRWESASYFCSNISAGQ